MRGRRWAAVVAVLCLLLAGCGGSPEPKPAPKAEPSTSPSASRYSPGDAGCGEGEDEGRRDSVRPPLRRMSSTTRRHWGHGALRDCRASTCASASRSTRMRASTIHRTRAAVSIEGGEWRPNRSADVLPDQPGDVLSVDAEIDYGPQVVGRARRRRPKQLRRRRSTRQRRSRLLGWTDWQVAEWIAEPRRHDPDSSSRPAGRLLNGSIAARATSRLLRARGDDSFFDGRHQADDVPARPEWRSQAAHPTPSQSRPNATSTATRAEPG